MPRPSKTTTQMNTWADRLAGFATEAAASEKSESLASTLSVRGGRLSYKGQEIPGNKLNVVVLDHVILNTYYPGRFDAENPVPPACYAYGRGDGSEMRPHDTCHEPQAAACHGCPMNEYGTSATGKGKACQNTRRLALITEGDLDDIGHAELAFFKISVTNVKAWAGYVTQIANTLRRPPFAVVTEISAKPDPKTQFRLEFKLMGQIDDSDQLEALLKRRQSISDEIVAPFPLMPEGAAPKANNTTRRPAQRSGKY